IVKPTGQYKAGHWRPLCGWSSLDVGNGATHYRHMRLVKLGQHFVDLAPLLGDCVF
ncbi:hypothetical protein GGI13_007135, partial [Coemansia sp. RSA 455]